MYAHTNTGSQTLRTHRHYSRCIVLKKTYKYIKKISLINFCYGFVTFRQINTDGKTNKDILYFSLRT